MKGLQGVALDVANDLTKRFPEVIITSGRRTVPEQADKMARNMLRNRDWIRQTYAGGRVANECQDWADRHEKRDLTLDAMREAFTAIISGFSEDEQRRLSRHLTGDALDIAPVVGGNAEEILRVLSDWATRKNGRFLTCEGGLDIWHWQAH